MLMNKTVHEQVTAFNTLLMNIFSNYILNKYIIIDDKDPPWMTKAIKDKINAKKSLCKSKKFIELQNLALDISEIISIRKDEYYDHLSKKLNNPNTSANKTNKRLYKLNIKEDDILKIIRKLNVNKAHGHDDISIRMLKNCDSVLTEPLSIIFNNCIDHGVFPDTWKMPHIIPIHKTDDKRSLNNYSPVSLLPICGKIFERTIFNDVFAFLENNNLLTPKQSGFRSNDSCVSQLIFIVFIQILILLHHLK